MKNILLFLAILTVTYPALIILTGLFVPQLFRPNISYQRGAYGHLYSRVKEIKDSVKDLDVLFLGSSHAYRGFDTRNFKNISSFNLGSSAQTPINTNVLLVRYLDKLNPRIVIYEVYPEGLMGDGAEASLDIISNDVNDIHSFRMSASSSNIKVYNTFVYAAFRDVFSISAAFNNKIVHSDRYISGGFVESDIRYFIFTTQKAKYWTLDEKQLKAFSENLSLLRRKNIKVILVFAPITSRLYHSYENNQYFDSLMKSHRLEYYNFNKLMELNDSLHFYDSHHLNQTGVNIFNKKMTEVIPWLTNIQHND